MQMTIEADIENGQLKGPELAQFPAQGHVLITLLEKTASPRPKFGTYTSAEVSMTADASEPLTDKEMKEWGL